MAIRRFSTAEPGVKSNKMWDQDTAQGAKVPIATVTVNSSTGTTGLTFLNIPQTYQDLELVVFGRSARAGLSGMSYHVTIGSGQLFSTTWFVGDGSTITSSRSTSAYDPTDGYIPGVTGLSGAFGIGVTHILNYANTSYFKTTITNGASNQSSTSTGYRSLFVNSQRFTAAVTGINVYTDYADVWAAGTTATLYGIKAGA